MMRGPRLLVALAQTVAPTCVCLAACASPTPAPRPVEPLPRPPAQPSPPTAKAPAPELPPAIEPLADPACAILTPRLPVESMEDSRRARRSLRFAAGAAPFADVYRGSHVELALSAGDATAGGVLSFDADGVDVRGVIEASEMPLYPATAFVVSGVFVPDGERRLLLRSTKPGLVTLAVEPVAKVRLLEGDLVLERRCSDVTLGPVALDAADVDRALGAHLPTDEFPPFPWKWLRQGRVPLAATPGGKPVAEIDSVEPPDDTLLLHPVRVLAAEKGQTRVAMPTFGGTLFGWVPTSRLRTSSRQFIDLQHDCFTILVSPPRTGDAFVACDHDVALVAEAGDQRRRVGTVRAGTFFERLGGADGWTRIDFRDAGIEPAEGAQLLVRDADVADCTMRQATALRSVDAQQQH